MLVQKTFGIYEEDITGEDLFVEIGWQHIACWAKNSNQVTAFEFFNIGDEVDSITEQVRQVKLHSKILEAGYTNNYILLENNECIISGAELPGKQLTEKIFSRLYGNAVTKAVETVEAKGKLFYYTIPLELKKVLTLQPGNTRFIHKYSRLVNGTVGDNTLHLVFYPDHISLLLQRPANGFFVNSYSYKTGEDVLYRVLHVLDSFEISQDEVSIGLLGLIDTNSKIYKELYAYFPHLTTIASVSALPSVFNEYPSHYFSPFFNFDV